MAVAGQRRRPSCIEPSLEEVLETAAELFGVGPARLTGGCRVNPLRRYRAAAMAAARELTTWSHAAIAEAFGRYSADVSVQAVVQAHNDPEVGRLRDAIVDETRRRRA